MTGSRYMDQLSRGHAYVLADRKTVRQAGRQADQQAIVLSPGRYGQADGWRE